MGLCIDEAPRLWVAGELSDLHGLARDMDIARQTPAITRWVASVSLALAASYEGSKPSE